MNPCRSQAHTLRQCFVVFRHLLLMMLAGFFQVGATAAPAPTIMSPIAVTGWNRDVVVESNAVGPPFTNYASG